MNIYLLVFSVLLAVAGQVLFKAATTNFFVYRIFGIDLGLLLAGVTIYFMSLIAYVFALKSTPLFIAYATLSIGYVVIFLLEIFGGLQFQLRHGIALILIVGGVFTLWL